MNHLSLDMGWQLNEDLNLSTTLYHNSYNDDRSITFTSYQPGNALRQRRFWDEQQLGMLSNLTWRSNDWLTLDGGINYEEQDNTYERRRFTYGVPTNFDATPARIQNDDHYRLCNVGGYVQAVIQPTDSLQIIPAMRVDKFSGSTKAFDGTSVAKRSLQEYGWIKQPKLSVVYSVNQDIDVYANWGRTFQILTGNADPGYLSMKLLSTTRQLTPVRKWVLNTAHSLAPRLELRYGNKMRPMKRRTCQLLGRQLDWGNPSSRHRFAVHCPA